MTSNDIKEVEDKSEFSQSGTAKSHNNSVKSSPNKSKRRCPSPSKSTVNSPAKLMANASPARQVPLTDYSPLKGPKSISSFFTPPQPVKISSLSASPPKATSFSSPIMMNSSNLKNQAQVSIEDSGSDLTVSEGESEKETLENRNNVEETAGEEAEEEISFKPVLNRGIPFNLNEEEEEEKEEEEEEEEKVDTETDAESDDECESESSDISVIISLPSTDSNDQVTTSRRVTDISSSEYESSISDEEEKEETEKIETLIVNDSDEEESDKIPVMLFSSNIQSSPKKKSTSPEKRPVAAPSADMPEKKIAPKRSFEEDLNVVKVSLARPTISESENHSLSPKKRSTSVSKVSEEVIHDRTITSTSPAVEPALQSTVQSLKPVSHINGQITTISANNYAHLAHKNIRPGPASVPTQQDPAATAVNRDQIYGNNHVAAAFSNLPIPIRSKTGYVYDERMLHHFDPHDPEHPEKPARISSIYEKLRAAKLLEKSYRIPLQIKMADFAPEVQSVHDTKYCRMINQTSLIRNVDELHQISSQFNSVYINPSTAISATVAAAATIELCHSIGKGEIENGFAIVRPPGHHAEHDEAMGFCIYNNVAVAASSLLRKGLARKVLILDWDVHHGNGTQNAFAESGDVLYISIHRYDGAKFYPHIEEANCSYVGAGTAGLGK
jgi:hypothetical protein